MLSSPAISATAQINHTYNASKRRKRIRTKLITIFYMQPEKGKAWMMNPVNCFSLIPHCLCHLKCTGLFHAAGTVKTGRVWKWEPVLLTACAKRQVRNNTCHLVPTLLTDSVNFELCLEPCFLGFHLRNYLISPSLGSRLNCWNTAPRKVVAQTQVLNPCVFLLFLLQGPTQVTVLNFRAPSIPATLQAKEKTSPALDILSCASTVLAKSQAMIPDLQWRPCPASCPALLPVSTQAVSTEVGLLQTQVLFPYPTSPASTIKCCNGLKEVEDC